MFENTSCKDLDFAAILALPAKFDKIKKTSQVPVLVDELLAENQQIIETLIKMQKERYLTSNATSLQPPAQTPAATPLLRQPVITTNSSSSTAVKPTDLELSFADTLTTNLLTLSKWTTPGFLASGIKSDSSFPHIVQVYSQGTRESYYKGTLDPKVSLLHLKAVSSNKVGLGSIGGPTSIPGQR